jgi:hypothetical protein
MDIQYSDDIGSQNTFDCREQQSTLEPHVCEKRNKGKCFPQIRAQSHWVDWPVINIYRCRRVLRVYKLAQELGTDVPASYTHAYLWLFV